MKSSLLFMTTIFAITVLATPTSAFDTSIEKRADRGHYTVPGLGTNKKSILNAGGNTLDLAIAMLETEDMDTSSYPYGDGKTYDAANFGLFKQNWGMLRVCAYRYGLAGESAAQWNDGALLNRNVYADVASRWDCQEHYGKDLWFAGQRNGATGLENPNTPDINNYRSAVEWIRQRIDSDDKYKYDDTRFWVDVPAI